MFFKRIFTEGLSHYSYMVGDEENIAVIDPRRDVGIYLEEARKANKKITHIFETHRNEDYISGTVELSEKTGAKIFISKYEDTGQEYGEKIGEEDEFVIGKIKIQAIHTPGHTLGHLSYVVSTEKDVFYMVFVGDTLFWGDIGRTDFYGEENLEKMTGLLYDSIFDKLFKLGDHVLMMPAHGSGSACGSNIEKRDYSTLGYERLGNVQLQVESRGEFIEKHGYMRLKPPYFDLMEKCNTTGAEPVGEEVNLNSLSISDLEKKDYTIIDLRRREAYVGKHVPNSLFISVDILSSHLGWQKDPKDKIAFLADGLKEDDVKLAYWTARRMGFDNIAGVYGEKTIFNMEINALDLSSIGEIDIKEYCKVYKESFILDVRKEEELKEDDYPYESRSVIAVQLLKNHIKELPQDKEILIFCGSGERSTLAASMLEREGIKSKVVSGGVKAARKYFNK